MGCGLVSQRRPVEVHRPLAVDPTERAARPRGNDNQASSRLGGPPEAQPASLDGHQNAQAGGPAEAQPASLDGRQNAQAGSPHHAHRHRAQPGAEAESPGPRIRGPSSRRLIAGECVVPTQLSGNVTDHAFCFECGLFFQMGSVRPPLCTRCNSSFIQILRSAGEQNWVTAEQDVDRGYSFDDQLDTSLTASFDAAPSNGKPTQVSFIQNLPVVHITESDVEARSKFGDGDPRSQCSVCRDNFAVGDVLKQMPCTHEFHEACIVPWLGTHNTCPICRWKCPEFIEGDNVGNAPSVQQAVGTAQQDHGVRRPSEQQPSPGGNVGSSVGRPRSVVSLDGPIE
mmetsp:Transcript_16789/g.43390  ORF Transcript_16789/g.43390 Transcript_16789/m.43390 type:complete len:340 (+) Transcript_16789:55-1074(+)